MENRVNKLARRLLPKAYAEIDTNTQFDRKNLRLGIEDTL